MGYNRYEEVYTTINNKNIIMINSYGYFTANYVRETGLPMKERKDNWLSKSQCNLIKKPVGEEELIDGIVGFARAMHGYYALYERNLSEDDKKLLLKKRKYKFKIKVLN